MSTRNRNNTARNIIVPIARLAGKTRVGQDDADTIAMPLLLHFDAAHRGQCSNVGQQHLYKHLLAAQCVAVRTKSRAFYQITVDACDALMKASMRPTQLLDLTTGEYQKIRKAIGWYVRALPMLEVGVLSGACEFAEAILNRVPEAA
jgi:hypothetical protein